VPVQWPYRIVFVVGREREGTQTSLPTLLTLHNQQMDFKHVAPLQATANCWDRKSFQVQADGDSPEMVERKVKGLLNKLTIEKYAMGEQVRERER